MKELQEIIQVWKQLPPQQTAALATLVKVEGSAYRRQKCENVDYFRRTTGRYD